MIPRGFRFSGIRCGLKNKRNDLGMIVSDREAVAAGLFTQNQVRAACVDLTKQAISDGRLRAVVVNSGNANCFTGAQGEADAREMVALAAEQIGAPANKVAIAQTGVIGKAMDMERARHGIRAAAAALAEAPNEFLEAILTTDLVTKSAYRRVGDAVIFGAAKGSGMIAPNMATMLAFLVTDLVTTPEELREALAAANDLSFGCLTVDGDTSTNDMVLALANGASDYRAPRHELRHAMTEVCIDLAEQIARDGEGATKLVRVTVHGSDDPKRIALTIANSPLVKTAIFGCDPNWGRIIAAAGRSGVPIDLARARLTFVIDGESWVLVENGAPATFDPASVSHAMKAATLDVVLDLGSGPTATIFTCDFGYGYVRINAEYHT